MHQVLYMHNQLWVQSPIPCLYFDYMLMNYKWHKHGVSDGLDMALKAHFSETLTMHIRIKCMTFGIFLSESG